MADGYNVAGGALQGATSGAMIGSTLGPVGTVVGGIVGAIGGGILGGKKKKYKAPKFASSNVYGYDSYGNLVSRGSMKYNPSTGQYELSAGELSPQEKAMRQNLAGNIEGLINTVGSTPDAFVRYAKELSNTYYKQGERKLSENVAKEQARLDESLARRGLSTSRAAADIQGELERRRQGTLADIYDASQMYGYNVQSGLMNQARSSLGKLAGYQQNLSNVDQAYLNQAINAQQIGQQYENAKARAGNMNIQMQNTGIDNLMGSISQLGSLAGYYMGSQNAQPTAGVAPGYNDQLTQNIQQYGAQNMPWTTFGGYYA